MTRQTTLIVAAMALMLAYVVGIFVGWTGDVDTALPWVAIACYFGALL
jgi:hypothetical protein